MFTNTKKQIGATWLHFYLWLHGLTAQKQKFLVREFIQSIDIPSTQTQNQYFLGFIGSYGVGKTTIAKKISQNLPFVVFASDDLRRFLEKQNISHAVIDDNRFVFLLGMKVLKQLVCMKINVILDADLREPYYREPLKRFAEASGIKLILILITADENMVRSRILERGKREESKFLKSNLDRHFEERKKIHSSYPLPQNIFYTLRNDDTIDLQLRVLIEKMTKELYV